MYLWGAAIAQWIRLSLPSYYPVFESQTHHVRFYQFKFDLWRFEKAEINRKAAGIGPFKKKRKFSFDQTHISLKANWTVTTPV